MVFRHHRSVQIMMMIIAAASSVGGAAEHMRARVSMLARPHRGKNQSRRDAPCLCRVVPSPRAGVAAVGSGDAASIAAPSKPRRAFCCLAQRRADKFVDWWRLCFEDDASVHLVQDNERC